VTSSLPSLRPRVFLPLVSALSGALLLLPGAARALEVAVSAPREHGGYVYCDVQVSQPFEARVRESLEHGMPATLAVHAELWRRRRGCGSPPRSARTGCRGYADQPRSSRSTSLGPTAPDPR